MSGLSQSWGIRNGRHEATVLKLIGASRGIGRAGQTFSAKLKTSRAPTIFSPIPRRGAATTQAKSTRKLRRRRRPTE
jgi:hypothetical protein